MTGTTHAEKRDKLRHSATGALTKNHGDAAKGGAGGKGTWGKAGDEKDATSAATDSRDPNYDSDEERSKTYRHLYRLVLAEEWEAAKKSGEYEGAELDFKTGYIHLSSADQVLGTANRFFADKDNVVVVQFTTRQVEKSGGTLKWERNEDGLFPHLYDANLPTAVGKVIPLQKEGAAFKAVDLSP